MKTSIFSILCFTQYFGILLGSLEYLILGLGLLSIEPDQKTCQCRSLSLW